MQIQKRMGNNFKDELKGSVDEVNATKKQIAKSFKAYGSSGLEDAKKHQLIYATKVIHAIAKSDLKHPKIYCDIITETFGDRLYPQAGVKYWETYIDSLRYFHYSLAAEKEYDLAAHIYNHVTLYSDKLESENVCFKLINIYSYHLILQNSRLTSSRNKALKDAENVLENLTLLLQEMLERNKQFHVPYKDVLKKLMQYMFPRTGQSSSIRFFNTLPENKVLNMFQSFFKLSTQQRMPLQSTQDIQQYGQSIIEMLFVLLQFDISNKFHLQLSVQLLNYCRADNQIKMENSMAEFYLVLYEYMKLVCHQSRVSEFAKHFTQLCKRFKELFVTYSKSVATQAWFQDYLVLFTYLHTHLQNTLVFSSLWEKLISPVCYNSLLELLLETMKLSPCISADTSLNWISCCSSFRKHIILSFAQTAISTYVLFCQNRSPDVHDDEVLDTVLKTESIKNNLLLIVNHAFKVLEKMDCITSTSLDISLLITRFKQAAVNAKTANEAKTCVALCELFLKIKTKIPDIEWPLMLRRVYKVVEQCMSDKWQLKRELQLCYIASMVQLTGQLDFTQIRAQITIFYSHAPPSDDNQQSSASSEMLHDKCLVHMYQLSTNPLKPYLTSTQKKLLHWLETQHIMKYYKTNEKLIQSLVQNCQTQYDFAIIARLDKIQPKHILSKLLSIQKSLKSKSEEAAVSLTRLELLTYGHTCLAILQDYKNSFIAKACKYESSDFSAAQIGSLLKRKEMEAINIRKELSYVKLAYIAFKAFREFFVKFDDEPIKSDDAIIDWEALMDDLVTLAQFFQLCGYIEYSSHTWMLLYNISQLMQDSFSSLRALTFMCEYSEFFENNKTTDLSFQFDKEIQLHLPCLTEELNKLSSLSGRKQSYVLMATIQIAYFYARCGKYSYAQMLLQFVEQKHNELPERQGRCDVVICSLDIVRYRLLWKHGDESITSSPAKAALLNQSLMLSIEQALEHFRNFVCFTSSDSLLYIVLLCNLLQDVTECSANRLYDNFMSNLFPAVCKCIFSHGLALRMVQLMSSWMWINLQMELVDDAHTNLKIIEYVMGVASLMELVIQNEISSKTEAKCSPFVTCSSIDTFGSMALDNGIETMRRLTQAQLSPIKKGKLQLSSVSRQRDLSNYLTYKIETKSLPLNELLEWMYFTIACFNARLNFLIDDFDQLEDFYEQGKEWLLQRKNDFNKGFFKNFQLIAMQHFSNFLRACRKTDKANECLNYALQQCASMKSNIDMVYRINFKLQLESNRMVVSSRTCLKLNSKTPIILSFNMPPSEDKEKYDKVKQTIKKNMLHQAMRKATKKPSVNIVLTANGGLASTARKQAVQPRTGSGEGSSSSEMKRNVKTKLKFNICTDSIEIFDLAKNNDAECKTAVNYKSKRNSPTNNIMEILYNPIKADQMIAKTPSKTKKINTTPPMVTLEILDSPPNCSSSIKNNSLPSSSSLSGSETKENHPECDLVPHTEKLVMTETKKKNGRGRTKQTPTTTTTSVIVLDDSPPASKPIENASRSRVKSYKTPNIVKDSKSDTLQRNEAALESRRAEHNSKDVSSLTSKAEKNVRSIRRTRKIISDTITSSECKEFIPNTTSATPITSSSVRTRRQKN